MMKLEPTTPSRSVGINCDEDLISALDELAALMEDDGVVPSRSEIARNLLWAAISLVKSPDPRAAALLKSLIDVETFQ